MTSIWPTIPDPGPDATTHYQVLMTLKNVVEMLTGQRKGAPPTPRVYRDLVKPAQENSPIPKEQLRDCDLWIDTTNSNKLYFWHGELKVWVATT